ncbi:MAG: DNA repair protein RadA, partial [Solirubrobacterales bacterium]
MARSGSRYACEQCGHEALTWTGQCPGCGEWNTLAERSARSRSGGRGRGRAKPAGDAPK